MRKYFLAVLLLIAAPLHAEGQFEGLQLAHAPINRADMDSIKRGAKFFSANCMSCHTMKYLSYNKIAKEANIDTTKAPITLNGVVPPDLSLEADARGVDWIYTYLQSFYEDKSSASGVNNLVFPGTAMPAILAPMQGTQVLVEKPSYDLLHEVQWYDLVKPIKEGSLPPGEFQETVTDLVNFLAYASEPFYNDQHELGKWVLGFIFVLFLLMYALKKEYWKDVKKRRDE